MRDYTLEFWHFFYANARAAAFGGFLLALFLLTEYVSVPYISRYDFIFLSAILYQTIALSFRLERPREFLVILLFHILATCMELFKTHPSIGSWQYPAISSAYFAVGTVPLFTGFLYSAVGSYISRAFTYLRLSYEHFPRYHHVWIIAFLIYLNFFTHHYFFDIRYLLFIYVCIVFFRTKVRYRVYTHERSMPFLVTALLTALFVWIGENIGTLTAIWLYPNQLETWQWVSVSKLGSWFLLLILSFALVSIIHRDRLSASK